MKLSIYSLAALLSLSMMAYATSVDPAAPGTHLDIDALSKAATDTFEYKAQTSRLMNLIVHSMYVNKEVFIRELLANACDAIDKKKREAFGNAELTQDITENSRVVVSVDRQAGTITFTDTGIGMTKDELRDYLGTIAKSGTSELLSKLKENKDASTLIGQFGVGFYSVFLVGDRVAVSSKSDKDDKQWVWTSSADSPGFAILEDPRGNTLRRGTEITIKLKAEEERFLDEKEVLKHMQTYATYFPYPIYIQLHKAVEKETSPADKDGEGDSAAKVEDDAESAKKTETVTVVEDFHVNSQKPLWLRDPRTVTKDEYAQMYRTVFKSTEDPLTYIQFSVEGDVSYKGILFVPKRAPFDIYNIKDARPDIHLYVRRSFVTDKIEDILPPTLAFVKGIVDSDDLPLNISRETLQNTVALRSIKAKVASKAVEMFKAIAEDDKEANAFYEQYGAHIKLEIARRENLRAKLAPLLRFETNKSAGKPVTLDKYVEGKQEGQKAIYFLSGSTKKEVEKSPFMERLSQRGLEVLYAVDPIDEQTLKAVSKYRELSFQSIAQDGFKLDDTEDDKARRESQERDFKPLMDWLKTELSKDVEKVVLSNKLVKSAFAVVANQFGFTGHMEKLYMSQQQGGKSDPMMSFFTGQKKILEINPDHQTVKTLLAAVGKGDQDKLKTITRALYDSALLSSGFTLHNPRRFNESIEKLSFQVLGEQYVAEPQEEEDDKSDNPFANFNFDGAADDVNPEDEANMEDEINPEDEVIPEFNTEESVSADGAGKKIEVEPEVTELTQEQVDRMTGKFAEERAAKEEL